MPCRPRDRLARRGARDSGAEEPRPRLVLTGRDNAGLLRQSQPGSAAHASMAAWKRPFIFRIRSLPGPRRRPMKRSGRRCGRNPTTPDNVAALPSFRRLHPILVEDRPGLRATLLL